MLYNKSMVISGDGNSMEGEGTTGGGLKPSDGPETGGLKLLSEGPDTGT